MPILVTVRSCFSHSLMCSSSASKHPPGLTMAVGTVRADPLEHLADQLLTELILASGAIHPELDGGRDVAPDRLSINADPLGDGAFAFTFQPAPQRLFDLDHRYLPKRHGASSPAALEAQPNVFSAGVGGPSGWSHNWQRGWSHVTGKTSDQLVPCDWQTTESKEATSQGSTSSAHHQTDGLGVGRTGPPSGGVGTSREPDGAPGDPSPPGRRVVAQDWAGDRCNATCRSQALPGAARGPWTPRSPARPPLRVETGERGETIGCPDLLWALVFCPLRA